MTTDFPNPLQRFTIAAAALALTTLTLFPPWEYSTKQGIKAFWGFHFLLTSPGTVSTYTIKLDTTLLFACAAIVLVIAAVFLLLFHGVTWNPFRVPGRILTHNITRFVLAGGLFISLIYLGVREYRIAGQIASYKQAMSEWTARVKSGKETDFEKLDPPILSLFADEPILSLIGLQESPYNSTIEERDLRNQALSQQGRLQSRARTQQLKEERNLSLDATLAEVYAAEIREAESKGKNYK